MENICVPRPHPGKQPPMSGPRGPSTLTSQPLAKCSGPQQVRDKPCPWAIMAGPVLPSPSPLTAWGRQQDAVFPAPALGPWHLQGLGSGTLVLCTSKYTGLAAPRPQSVWPRGSAGPLNPGLTCKGRVQWAGHRLAPGHLVDRSPPALHLNPSPTQAWEPRRA